ncbi:MAG TPA: DinB family protein [Candidatus Acidoferrales bacterium]|nr:DinB family protein [Candidatus Acidoferrales bacterium]
MKKVSILAVIAAFFPLAGLAQQASSNPASDAARSIVAQKAKSIVAAAEEMPADKYSYRPTPGQITFAHLVMHLAGSNYFLCSAVAGTKPPETEKLADTDPKDKLVGALKASFDYCNGVMEKTDDSKLGEAASLPFYSGPQTRAAAMIIFTDDLFDHYSQAAMYLRMNGLLPPTAQPKKQN